MKIFKFLKIMRHDQRGSSLVETAVTLAVVGTIAVVFLSGLVTSSKATLITDRHTTAESLAQTQMEWAKNASYVYEATSYPPTPLPSGKDYIDYSVSIAASPLHSPDDGIQKITVTVMHSGENTMFLEGYKVDR
jgi:type II secretory pathway pseudopilin PulG